MQTSVLHSPKLVRNILHLSVKWSFVNCLELVFNHFWTFNSIRVTFFVITRKKFWFCGHVNSWAAELSIESSLKRASTQTAKGEVRKKYELCVRNADSIILWNWKGRIQDEVSRKLQSYMKKISKDFCYSDFTWNHFFFGFKMLQKIAILTFLMF